MNLTFNSENQNYQDNQEKPVNDQIIKTPAKQGTNQFISAIEMNLNATPVNKREDQSAKDQFKNNIDQKKQYQSKEPQNQKEKDKIKLEDIFESKIHYNQNLKDQNIKGQSQSNNDMAEIKHLYEKIEKYDQNQILLNLASAIEKLDSTLTNFVNVQSKINEDQSSLNASFKKSMDEQLSLFRKSIENQNTFNNMVFQWMQNQQGQNQGKNPGN